MGPAMRRFLVSRRIAGTVSGVAVAVMAFLRCRGSMVSTPTEVATVHAAKASRRSGGTAVQKLTLLINNRVSSLVYCLWLHFCQSASSAPAARG